MKILLTGAPRSGKTTLLEDFIQHVPHKLGFVAREVRSNGERTGFEIVSSSGEKVLLAHENSKSEAQVGRYGVELNAFNNFLAELPAPDSDAVLYVDEVGKMQLFSDAFKVLVRQYLNAPNLYVGTISSTYENDFIAEVLERPDVILLTVNPNDRSKVKDALYGLALNTNQLQELNAQARQKLIALSQNYAQASQWLQLSKLWKNAIKYVAEKRIRQLSSTEFLVEGNTRDHKVVLSSDGMNCDCELFHGTGVYKDASGECSHIQTVKLLNNT